MRYLRFLRKVHDLLAPPTYLEIGVRHGKSLALARALNVGIDPAFDLQKEVPPRTTLFEETSDEYFDRADPLEPLEGRRVALSFIDGMHLVEFALRDFINVECYADWTSVVVFDDIYPREIEEASRKRRTYMWTGDVYKIVSILARNRPDLILLPVDTGPTGLLLVLGLDPESTVLDDRYDDILREAVVPDPQEVPAEVMERHGTIDPAAVLEASFWKFLREARENGMAAREGLPQLHRLMRDELGEGVIAARGGRLAAARA